MSATSAEKVITDRLRELAQEACTLKQKLFELRLSVMADIHDEDVDEKKSDTITFESLGITNLRFIPGNDDEWCLTYEHKTEKYNVNNYTNSEESEDEDAQDIKKETKVCVGFEKNSYYLHGTSKRRFNIYRHNTTKQIKVKNTLYRMQLDQIEQRELMNKYVDNLDIPEWLAIKVLLHMQDEEWDDKHLILHFDKI